MTGGTLSESPRGGDIVHRNRHAGRILGASGLILLAGWGFGALLLIPSIGAPAPWTQLIGGIFLAAGWVFITTKVPLAVAVGPDRLRFRFVFRAKSISPALVSYVEYRIDSMYLSRVPENRPYSMTLRSGSRRLLDVGVDAHIAGHVLSVVTAPQRVLKVYQGRQLLEERPISRLP